MANDTSMTAEAVGRQILDQIHAAARERRANPVQFFQQFLRDIWMDNSPDEARAQWQVKVEQYPWYADDALACLDAVIANPPDNLAAILEEDGWISLYHETPDEVCAYDPQETLDWLKGMRSEFKAVYEQAARG